ncbi:MAG TPA: hypothetical protein PKI27_03565 [Dermatophilaceae bacterium]|nr:hypothetical protein [Dermatophilaceae bacterium]
MASVVKTISADVDQYADVAGEIAAVTSNSNIFPTTLADADYVVVVAEGNLTFADHTSTPNIKGYAKSGEVVVIPCTVAITAFYISNAGASAVAYRVLFVKES